MTPFPLTQATPVPELFMTYRVLTALLEHFASATQALANLSFKFRGESFVEHVSELTLAIR